MILFIINLYTKYVSVTCTICMNNIFLITKFIIQLCVNKLTYRNGYLKRMHLITFEVLSVIMNIHK